MRKFIGLLAIIALGAVLWAETDYQVGQGVERVITRRLQVQGHNAKAIIAGELEITGDITHTGASTVSGKLQADGELEANADVDINLGSATEEITIDQTNAAGTSATPMMAITDARTGSTANSTNEATVWIQAQGSYALCVEKGASAFKETEFSGTYTEVDSSKGYFRVGYPTDLGWQINTIGGGATLQFQTDFARTGMVTRVSMSSAGLAASGISGVLCASMPVSATYSTTTNGAITVQAKDPAGANLARATGFEFWFSTAAVQTLPNTNSIESFSVQNGDMRMYREVDTAVPTYVAQTDNTGLFKVNTVVYTNAAYSLTNYFHLLGPNGYYTNFQCKYTP
jgi:hypothetical protein